MKRERLQEQALTLGEYLIAGLRELAERHSLIGDVRGSGLFLGVELVRDRHTLEPAATEASEVANCLRDGGILLGTDRPFHNVLKIRPPMPFGRGDANALIEALDRTLALLQAYLRVDRGVLALVSNRT